MHIAYLVLCHRDAAHIGRLARVLTQDTDAHVVVHVDAKSDMAPFAAALNGVPRVELLADRVAVWWGGLSAVCATQRLLERALRLPAVERLVLLQGADYPLRSNAQLHAFFAAHPRTEYIRACNAGSSASRYLYAKARYPQWFDRPNIAKRALNRFIRSADLRLKAPTVRRAGTPLQIYWGCAQWAVTRACAELFVAARDDAEFNRYFRSSFPADEIYFHTIAHNSEFSAATLHGGAEADVANVTELRNLHYFEYPHDVRIFTAADYAMLQATDALFVRKVTSAASGALLDLIDSGHAAEAQP